MWILKKEKKDIKTHAVTFYSFDFSGLYTNYSPLKAKSQIKRTGSKLFH